MKDILKNPQFVSILKIVFVLYAAQISPKLPQVVISALENTYVKMVVITLVMYLAKFDFQIALVLAVGYVLAVNALSGRGLLESFENISLITRRADVYPGCENVTMKDLLAVFENERKLADTVRYTYRDLLVQNANGTPNEKLMQIAKASGLPGNIPFNDENAKIIATFLLYAGFKVTPDCNI